jgi:hypothetical protein
MADPLLDVLMYFLKKYNNALQKASTFTMLELPLCPVFDSLVHLELKNLFWLYEAGLRMEEE